MYADGQIRLAALLHDIGKPYCKQTQGTYHNHENESARIAGEVCTRLKVPKKLTAEVVRLCATHMYDMRCDARENKIRKFIVRNSDILEKLLLLKQAAYTACRDDFAEAPCVAKWKGIYENMLRDGAPLYLKDLAIKGDELAAAGIPNEKIGKVLSLLLSDAAIWPQTNKKQKLLKRALAYAEQDI